MDLHGERLTISPKFLLSLLFVNSYGRIIPYSIMASVILICSQLSMVPVSSTMPVRRLMLLKAYCLSRTHRYGPTARWPSFERKLHLNSSIAKTHYISAYFFYVSSPGYGSEHIAVRRVYPIAISTCAL